jgi:polysaccharide export outer membrane protein
MPTLHAPFVVRTDDVVKLKFLYHPELNETQTVRPDGKISPQLLNDIEVAGLTPEKIKQELLALYADILKDPKITVIVETERRYVLVGGEVDIPPGQFPIMVPYVEGLTPMEAILQAGGFRKASANLSNVLIVRRIEDKQYLRTVDLRAAMRNAESSAFHLEPNDIVFVPRTKIDRANQWVDQYMNKLVPDWVSANIGYSYVRNRLIGGGTTVTASPTGVSATQTD